VPHWGKGQVRKMLCNPAYKGESVAWRYTGGGRIRSSEEWIPLPAGTTPAIVSRALWETVQDRLKVNRGADVRNQKRPYLLRGLIFCGICQRRMRSSPEHTLRTYRCSSRETASGPCGGQRVRAVDVEAWAWEEVSAILRDPSLIAAELNRRRAEGPDPTLLANREATQRALAKLEKQQERLVRHFREADDDTFPWDLVKREIAQTEQQKGQLRATLAELDQRLVEQQVMVEQLDALAAYCARVVQNLECFDFDGRRLALEALGVRITASGRRWQLHVSIPIEAAVGKTNTTSECCALRQRRLRAPASPAPGL
jgi:site-specific DNA recombinase